MSELIHEHSSHVVDDAGRVYAARILAEEEPSGGWVGWLEFHPLDGGEALRTGTETTQPSRGAIAYWASGLEPVYLEGAFERAARLASCLEHYIGT